MAIRNLKGDPIETSIQKDARSFSKSLSQLAEFCTDNYEAVVTKTVIDLFRRIVERTPIDTGRARANWSIGPDPNAAVDYKDLSDVADYEYKLDTGTIWIFNNLVYIVPLEEGHSDQAPQGMVAISLAEFSTFLKDAAKQLSNVVQPKG